MWTETTRPKYERRTGRYASDLTDAEFALIEPLVPAAKRIGRPPTVDRCAILNAIFYLLTTGCQWRMLPKDFPPMSPVHGYLTAWSEAETWEAIHFALYQQAREAEGRAPSPSAGVIGSQSVKTRESGGIRGFDAGKKVKGRKRHILVDTIGLLLVFAVHAANVQDRDGAVQVFKAMARLFPWLEIVFADGAYGGDKFRRALVPLGNGTLEKFPRPRL